MTEVQFRSDVKVQMHRHAATDLDVIQAARVSTLGEGTVDAATSTTQMRGLINYLMRDRHGSPFEHNSMTFFIQAPIFVAREFMRHRVGFSYNEESARYRELKPVFYVPNVTRKLVQVGKAGEYRFEAGTHEQLLQVEHSLEVVYRAAFSHYEQLLRAGVAREVARMLLPVGIYTSFYVTCNARSLMNLLALRTHDERATTPSHPQREIEMVAEQMEELWGRRMPLTHDAFNQNGRVAP